MPTQPQRIAFIDFMKCLCIMLIVMYHIDHDFFDYLAPNLNNALQAFRLPMYYFISGIFFKHYNGFADFTRRKVNNILVPFVFFIVLVFALRLPQALLCRALGSDVVTVSWGDLIDPFVQRYWLITTPLWFLLSLFWVNVVFYLLQQVIKPWWGVLMAVVAISLLGYEMGIRGLRLPLMMDTALVAMPYFFLGWGMKRLGALNPSRWDRWGFVALLVVALPVYILSEFMNLHFQVLPPYWKLYLLPFVAIVALFWACKPLPHIPVLCHYGRFSLIILGTHPLFFLPIRSLCVLRLGMEPGITLTVLVFVLTMILEWPTIWLLKTYFPRFTAQQPLFKPGWKL